MISEGNKIARAMGIRFIESTKGTMGLEVAFKANDKDSSGVEKSYDMFWTGWLSDAAIQNTMKTLVEVLEFNGDEEVVQVPDGDRRKGMLKNQDAINRKKDVQLVVELETYEGNTRPKIKWVNNVGGGQFSGLAPEVVKPRLEQMGFRAQFLAAKQGTPPQASVSQSTENPKNAEFTVDDIPF